MTAIKEEVIFETLKNITEVPGYVIPESYPADLKTFFRSFSERLTIITDAEGYEVSITGNKMPAWIRPLHFEQNLNSAIDALEAVEELKREELEHTMLNFHLNYYDQYFTKNKGKGDVNFKKYKEHLSETNLSGKKENLSLRLLQKIFELIEYTKAAKWGAKKVFGIESEDIEYSGSFTCVNKIRESLRLLLNKQKEIQKNDQDIIIPISLKQTKIDDDTWLVPRWARENVPDATDKQRHPREPLGITRFDFLLNEVPAIRELKNARLRRVGVQVVDSKSLTPHNANDSEDASHANIWGLSLFDIYGKIHFEDNVIKEYLEMSYYTPANKNAGVITWNTDDGIVNMKPASRWILTLNPKSHTGAVYTSVRDIILYFHVTHNHFWKP